MNRNLFSLQGYVRIGKRKADGRPGQTYWAGNVPEATDFASFLLPNEPKDGNDPFDDDGDPFIRISRD